MTSSCEADAIASGLPHAFVFEDSRTDHLRQVRFLVLLHSFNQFLNFASMEELGEDVLENLRLACGRAEIAVLVNHHCHRKER